MVLLGDREYRYTMPGGLKAPLANGCAVMLVPMVKTLMSVNGSELRDFLGNDLVTSATTCASATAVCSEQ